MSEYQFYEFKAIDKPLSESDKKEIGSWSSRAHPSNTGVTFEYNYSDFGHDEIEVVEKYFDAMFYISNWGTTQLVFKLPNNLINIKELRQYRIEDGLRLIEKSDFTILDICISEEEGGRGWIEGEGYLSSLISLRDDILSGDYRCLYLIWLKVTVDEVLNEWVDTDIDAIEPEVPGNLKSLNASLMDFTDLFEIDKNVIAVASENSPSFSTNNNLSDYIDRLSNKEKDKYLLQLLNNEPSLHIKFKNLLKSFGNNKLEENIEKRRTVREITENVKEMEEKSNLEKKQKQKEEIIAKFKKIEEQQSFLWDKIEELIKEKKTKSYDEAVKMLKDLKELSIYKNQFFNFVEKVEKIKTNYKNLSGLKWRIENAKLIEKN